MYLKTEIPFSKLIIIKILRQWKQHNQKGLKKRFKKKNLKPVDMVQENKQSNW